MLRFHFSDDRREPVASAPAPDPMWEVLLSLHLLLGAAGGTAYERWRAGVYARMTPGMWALASLAPPTGYSPDFLTPYCEGDGLDRGIDALLRTPRRRVHDDLAHLIAEHGGSGVAGGLMRDGSALTGLARAVRSYYGLALAPHWDRIDAAVAVGRAPGGGGLPVAFGPHAQWRGGVLEVAYPDERDVWLRGRTLTLVPSFFCRRYPITVLDPELPPVLVYPAHVPADPPGRRDGTAARERHALARLLGHTRAQVLEGAVAGSTTGELARLLDISEPTVSVHVAVLRDTGLMTSSRNRNRVRHVATDQGRRLLGDLADDFAHILDAPPARGGPVAAGRRGAAG
ncbi:ArsR family transcriptional regulator [Murinocardiopsis flavida]|uniref:ArsR family transcriptional regulator n=1 Tax=Murinocardiopsis flavida TaxID=645275 RepID=A0A2P8DME0_9ACTN|nr:helix-turn-helix domain-containing protein [Murinocardiopsis flavida]PSK98378.1 ArsR family transcriptional regulator [Murinocardiopsis flavida]